MADVLVLKWDGKDWVSRGVIAEVESAEEAIKQAYTGAGRYCALDFATRFEGDAAEDPVEVRPVTPETPPEPPADLPPA